MARINVEDLLPGMTLASDLYGPNGRFLLPRGTVLSERHLRVSKMWGVAEADIDDLRAEEAQASQERRFSPDILALARRIAEERFQRCDDSQELIRELKRLCVLAAARRLSAGQSVPHGNAQETVASPDPPPRLPCRPQDILSVDVQLASLPDIFVRINEVLNNPRSSVAHVADAIGKDQSLSAKLLKLVNSPFYGFASRIETLTRAVTIIGSRQLTMLALGISVISHFKDIPQTLLDMRAFWSHSIACGIVAKLLASHLAPAAEERCFVAGLLHDIGRLVIFKNAPEVGRVIVASAWQANLDMLEAEQVLLGFDHARVGGLLTLGWRLPPVLERAVRHHHAPSRGEEGREAALVNAADAIAHALLYGSGGAALVPPVDVQAWQGLGLTKGMLPQVALQVERQVEEVFKLFIMEEEAPGAARGEA